MFDEMGTVASEGLEDRNPIETIDEVDVGDLSGVKDEKPLVPPTNNVKMIIKRVSANQSKAKDGQPAGAYRWINLGLQIVDGINEEGKYQNMYVNTDNIAYYADPQYYPKMAANKQWLGKLGDLQRATGTVGMKINDDFMEAIKEKTILADIKQIKDDYKGENVNVARYLKPIATSDMV